ncbi:MAG: hypothetical protein QM654_07555 [Dysgonamonadaceae bacterium]
MNPIGDKWDAGSELFLAVCVFNLTDEVVILPDCLFIKGSHVGSQKINSYIFVDCSAIFDASVYFLHLLRLLLIAQACYLIMSCNRWATFNDSSHSFNYFFVAFGAVFFVIASLILSISHSKRSFH